MFGCSTPDCVGGESNKDREFVCKVSPKASQCCFQMYCYKNEKLKSNVSVLRKFLSLPPIKLAHFICVCWSVKLLHCITRNKEHTNFVPFVWSPKMFLRQFSLDYHFKPAWHIYCIRNVNPKIGGKPGKICSVKFTLKSKRKLTYSCC